MSASDISSRAQALEFSPIRKLTPYAAAAGKKGIKVYHLNIGQPDIVSPAIFLRAIGRFDKKVVAYEKSDGNEALKDSLIKYYRRLGLTALAKEDLVVTTGGSEALQWAFFILFNAGQECLTLDPTYTNYLTFAAQAGVVLRGIATKIENNFQLPPVKVIRAAVGPKTRGIIITNPSNPTGAVYSKQTLGELVELCLEKRLFIIADETYREFVYGKTKCVSLLSFKKARELVVSADSLSKRYSLCGARLGMLVSKNSQVMEAANKIAQARLAAPTIEQEAAAGLDRVPESYFAKVKAEYQKRRDTLIGELERIPGITISRPEGAFYLIAQLPVENAEDFCQWLLEKFHDRNETVMLAPANGFYVTPGLGKNQVRLAYVLKTKDLVRSARLLGLGLQAYSSRKTKTPL